MKLWGVALALTLCQAQTALPELDGIMTQALSRYGVKGGALAVVKDGHLIYARGYGWADVEGQEAVQPESLFRWCSVSKTLTAAAVMRLVEENRLDLDRPVFDILDQFTPYNGVWGDSRLRGVTMRQVLHHTGGWDRATSAALDPVVAEGSVRAAQAVGTGFPPALSTVIRYMLAQRLEFTPGARFAYSNFGYELLGRAIEKVTGQSYESYVREKVLGPAGLPRVQQGSAHLAGRLQGEVKYYDFAGAALVNSYVSAARERVAAPYGILNPELEDAAGAWVGSVVDLAKMVSLLDGARAPALVGTASFPLMLRQSQPATWVDAAGWYGFGLFVQPQPDGGLMWDHGGFNPGSRSGFYRFANGMGFAFLFNGEAADSNSVAAYAAQSLADALHRDGAQWPEVDLFPQYYAPRIAEGGVVNAASFQAGAVAPGSLITIFGTDLGGRDAEAGVTLRDAGGTERAAQVVATAPNQLNVVLPAEAAPGGGQVLVRRSGWPDAQAAVALAAVGPGIFLLNGNGLAAASLVRSRPGGAPQWEEVYEVDAGGAVVAKPIAFGPADEALFLVLYCTGVRGGSRATVRMGGQTLTTAYAGAQGQYAGLDQVNIELPRSLAGAGAVSVQVDVDGAESNVTSLLFR